MTNRVIVNMEGRGGSFIFHWYVYMLGGLRSVPNNITGIIHNSYIPYTWEQNIEKINLDKSHFAYTWEQNVQNIPNNSKNVTKPFYITCLNLDKFEKHQQESLEIIKSDFCFIHRNGVTKDDIVLHHYGEKVNYFCNRLNKQYHVDPKTYDFLRQLFLKNINVIHPKHTNKKYYISRNKSHLLEGNEGLRRRQILNEDIFVNELQKYNFEKIYLEDYTTKEKIQLFNEANTIISPNSGALTFTLFSGLDTKIVELNVANPHQAKDQYSSQCEHLGIPYYFYETHKADGLDNMTINVSNFVDFLSKNNIIQ